MHPIRRLISRRLITDAAADRLKQWEHRLGHIVRQITVFTVGVSACAVRPQKERLRLTYHSDQTRPFMKIRRANDGKGEQCKMTRASGVSPTTRQHVFLSFIGPIWQSKGRTLANHYRRWFDQPLVATMNMPELLLPLTATYNISTLLPFI